MANQIRQYANILLLKTENAKNEEELKNILRAFAQVLIEKGMTSKFLEIIKIWSALWDKKHESVDAKIEVASLVDFDIKKMSLPSNINSLLKENKALLAGISIRIGDYFVDNTLRRKINMLKGSIGGVAK